MTCNAWSSYSKECLVVTACRSVACHNSVLHPDTHPVVFAVSLGQVRITIDRRLHVSKDFSHLGTISKKSDSNIYYVVRLPLLVRRLEDTVFHPHLSTALAYLEPSTSVQYGHPTSCVQLCKAIPFYIHALLRHNIGIRPQSTPTKGSGGGGLPLV